MNIRKIQNTSEFDKLTEDWRTLQVWTFGPLADLDDADENSEIQVLIGEVDNEPIAYLIADGNEGWHIETKDDHAGHGYARQLNDFAGIEFACEVCSDDGAALCENLGIEFDDAR